MPREVSLPQPTAEPAQHRYLKHERAPRDVVGGIEGVHDGEALRLVAGLLAEALALLVVAETPVATGHAHALPLQRAAVEAEVVGEEQAQVLIELARVLMTPPCNM